MRLRQLLAVGAFASAIAVIVLVIVGTSGHSSAKAAREAAALARSGGVVAPSSASPAQTTVSAGALIPADTAWPPAADPADQSSPRIVIPDSWSDADTEQARVWLAAERETFRCMAERGISYSYGPVWTAFDGSGQPVADPAPPVWEDHMQRPFMYFLDSARVCWNRALVSVGRPAIGPTEFEPTAPRFEESDFDDPSTLDIPADWAADEQARARDAWARELAVRACMTAAGYSAYGQTPYWKTTPEAEAARDPWVNTLPLEQQPAAQAALTGQGGCDG
jgi:hypothetical protein